MGYVFQGRSSRILIGPADFPPAMGEVWFLGLGVKLEARRAEAQGPKGRERGWGGALAANGFWT